MKILLIDDHPLFREGLALLLRPLMDGLQVTEADSCEQGFTLLEQDGPVDLILIDMTLPGMHGLQGIPRLRELAPQAAVVALSSLDDRSTVLQAIEAGAAGFIPKSSTSAVMLAALKLVLARGIYLPPTAFLEERSPSLELTQVATGDQGQGTVTTQTLGLTSRQSEVLYLILQGKSAKLIERELCLSASTVKAHTSSVLRALNVTTRTQAVVAAGRLGLRFGSNSTP
jgi:DNA-binding NarL/FixJ family response regulator